MEVVHQQLENLVEVLEVQQGKTEPHRDKRGLLQDKTEGHHKEEHHQENRCLMILAIR
jgi:hypothetical protein